MSQQENISLFDFQARFSNEEVCQEHLFNIRWEYTTKLSLSITSEFQRFAKMIAV